MRDQDHKKNTISIQENSSFISGSGFMIYFTNMAGDVDESADDRG